MERVTKEESSRGKRKLRGRRDKGIVLGDLCHLGNFRPLPCSFLKKGKQVSSPFHYGDENSTQQGWASFVVGNRAGPSPPSAKDSTGMPRWVSGGVLFQTTHTHTVDTCLAV